MPNLHVRLGIYKGEILSPHSPHPPTAQCPPGQLPAPPHKQVLQPKPPIRHDPPLPTFLHIQLLSSPF